MNITRFFKHLLIPDWAARRAFSSKDLFNIEKAIKSSENEHIGELRFVVEGTLPLHYLFSEKRIRQRAQELFSQLRVWDTEHNSGVLIYVQLVDRRIEIVADRGINAKVEQAQWAAVCRTMEKSFKDGKFAEGALEAIARITQLIVGHFPLRGANPNELSDKPVVL